jgi:glutathione synthase/RimK-type ligase-like ATP-grasp enzyme
MPAADQCVLIVSSLFEPNVNRVIRDLEARGVRWYRFNTETFPLLCQGRVRFDDAGGPHFQLAADGQALDSRDVAAVWYRRQSEPVLARGLADADREFARLECLGYFHALYRCLDHCRWVNPWGAERAAADKTTQLALARAVGLTVPRTLVTNDPAAVREFLGRCAGRVVFKPLVGLLTGKPPDYSRQLEAAFAGKFVFPPAAADGPAERDRRVVFTQLLTEDRLEEIAALAACPAIFQEYVDKEVELRITVVGTEVFTAAIHSQERAETRVDFRRLALLPAGQSVRHTAADLPAPVRARLLALMGRLGLAFGCVDMIRTPGGDHVFLEVNPSGQWGWIEQMTGMPITSALVDFLLAG